MFDYFELSNRLYIILTNDLGLSHFLKADFNFFEKKRLPKIVSINQTTKNLNKKKRKTLNVKFSLIIFVISKETIKENRIAIIILFLLLSKFDLFRINLVRCCLLILASRRRNLRFFLCCD